MKLRSIGHRQTARICGIGHMSLWRLLTGHGDARIDILKKIASGLAMDVRDLVRDKELGPRLTARGVYAARLAQDCEEPDLIAIVGILRRHQAPKNEKRKPQNRDTQDLETSTAEPWNEEGGRDPRDAEADMQDLQSRGGGEDQSCDLGAAARPEDREGLRP